MKKVYIGTKHCGCVVAAFVDRQEYKNEIAEVVSGWIKDGLAVTRIDVVDIKLTSCKCNEQQTKTLND